jgi:hypothetical protein
MRRAQWAGALVLVLVAAVALGAATPASAAASGGPAAASAAASAGSRALVPPVRPAPTQVPSDLGRVPCLPVVGCDPLGGLGTSAANAMAQAVFTAFGTFVADGVRLVLDEMGTAISDTTKAKLGRQWFDSHFNVMRSLAVLILLPMMLVGLISSVIHRDVGQLARAGGVYVPVAIVGGAMSILLTEQALQVTDAATTFVTGDMTASVNRATAALADAVTKLVSARAPGLGTFLGIVVMLLLMFGALLIWIELLLRTSAIYVVVLFLPLALSGLVWRGTVAWTRRMIEVLVALILSKFVIVVVLDLAAGMVTAGDGIGTVMQGAALLLLAALAPFALLRLVPIVEAGVIGHLERMERRPVAAVTRATVAVARLAVAGAEASAAGFALQKNGGDPGSGSDQPREPGGQLNHVRIPSEASAPGASPTSAAVVSSPPARQPSGLPTPSSPDQAPTSPDLADAARGN